jgi:hypothetical protein
MPLAARPITPLNLRDREPIENCDHSQFLIVRLNESKRHFPWDLRPFIAHSRGR